MERGEAAPSIRRSRPDVPWSLESITRKCLAPDPDRRYQQAEHLAEDLRRFLDDRPLKYAPELSRVEQVRKYLRRHPRLASSASIVAAAALLAFFLGTMLVGTGRPWRPLAAGFGGSGQGAETGPRRGDDRGALPGQHGDRSGRTT